MFFSATMPASIREFADQFLRDPATVSIKPAATTAERVDQFATFVNQSEKQALLTMTLSDPAIERALVFTRTKHGADRVVRLLGGNGIEAATRSTATRASRSASARWPRSSRVRSRC